MESKKALGSKGTAAKLLLNKSPASVGTGGGKWAKTVVSPEEPLKVGISKSSLDLGLGCSLGSGSHHVC